MRLSKINNEPEKSLNEFQNVNKCMKWALQGVTVYQSKHKTGEGNIPNISQK